MRQVPPKRAENFSRGFDRGNYGNAYESQDWEAWSARNRFDECQPGTRDGMLLGFFSSYELHEIHDEDVRERVANLRAKYGDS